MNRGIYSTVSGMVATQKWMDVTANNLANISTTGFKRDGVSFTDSLQREMVAANGQGESLGTLGSGPNSTGNEFTVMEQGPIQSTGRPLDVAVDGTKGMFAVQTPQGIRYTRDGAFELNEQRQLVTTNGFPVLDSTQRPIEIPQGSVSIDGNGQISVDANSVGTLAIFDGTFSKEGGNLYTSDDAVPFEGAIIKPQALEGSNVNPVEAMIEMIQIGRAYELSQKAVQQQDDLSQRLIQSLSTKS